MAQHHGMKQFKSMSAFCTRGHTPVRGDRFGRLFSDIPPAYVPPTTLAAIGRKNGPMDGGSKADRTKSVAVGQVIFGQFIDHDITLDVTSSFSRLNDPSGTQNIRTPTLDLDCIYGLGPEPHPFLYSQTSPFNGAKLLTGADEPGGDSLRANDLLRAPNQRAIIGDPRNDENRVVSQLQLGIIKFHNAMCEQLHAESCNELTGSELFEEARRKTTWHYQWAVVNDFLVAMCGAPVVQDILSCGRKYYCPGEPYIPIEFAVAAYRFGHSMVPMKIQVQKGGKQELFFGPVLGGGFDPLTSTKAIVDWHELFFTSENRHVQTAEKLNTLMAGDLLQLPFIPDGEASLATRNLLRGNSFLLPGGDKVAKGMERPTAEIKKVMKRIADLSEAALIDAGIDGSPITEGAPLWLYLLSEAEVIGRETKADHFDKGEGLGPVGARIVAEVLIGLLELDEHSYLGANRNWVPMSDYDTIGKILASTNSDEL